MSLVRPCSACASRLPGKNSNVTWAWYRADGERVAYRQYLCVACFISNAAGLEPPEDQAELMCPVCHSSSGDNLDPVYVTIYIPGRGKVQWELPTCGTCAVTVRGRAQSGAERLENRSPEFGGLVPGPQTDVPQTPWDQLGLRALR